MWSGNVSGSTRLRRTAAAVVCGALLALAATSGCSGRSSTLDAPASSNGEAGLDDPGPSAGRGGGSFAGNGGSAGTSIDAGTDAASGSGGTAGGPSDAGDEPYVDPGCPDAGAAPGTIECDPFIAPSGCVDGFACKPSIEHPYGDGCDQQTFSMLCRPAGPGVQGDDCLSGSDCADGFICVVGAGAGKLCLRMCPLDGSSSCPPGYVCGETDALGIGVCA